ncbi:MAG: iron ABC transporter permease [Pseudomonadota bacterium]|nr:iron ABC transporter permease [Pseudomonadota bacterium]
MNQGGLDWKGRTFLAAGGLIAAYLVAVPLGMLVVTAFRGPSDFLPFESGAGWTLQNIRRIYSNPLLYEVIVPDTFAFVVGTVVLVSLIGFALAWLVERTDLPGRKLWFPLILFPLLVPTQVLGIAWISLAGPNAGWINVWLRPLPGIDAASGPLNIFSMSGLVIAQALATAPFVFLLLTATLRSMNPSLEEASAASGASPLRTFGRVTLPVLLPGILAPLILVTLITLEQFELPLIIGLPANINVFSYRILWELMPASGLPRYGAASAVALPFLAVAALLLVAYNRVIRRADSYVTVTGKAYRQRRLPLGRWKLPAVTFVGVYVLMAAVLPAAFLAWISFFGYAPPSLDELSRGSTSGYRSLFSDELFLRGVANTLIVASSSAVIVTVLGLIVGWIVARSRLWGRGALDFLSFMSVGVPSVIVGLAVMLLYLSLPIGLYGTIGILIVAFSYRIATTTRLARAGLMQLHPELEEASAASGATWNTTQLRIVLPLLLPAMASGFILLFIVGIREFTIPLVLYTQDNVVLSVLLWHLFSGGRTMEAAALATLIIAFVIPVLLVARRLLATRALAE